MKVFTLILSLTALSQFASFSANAEVSCTQKTKLKILNYVSIQNGESEAVFGFAASDGYSLKAYKACRAAIQGIEDDAQAYSEGAEAIKAVQEEFQSIDPSSIPLRGHID